MAEIINITHTDLDGEGCHQFLQMANHAIDVIYCEAGEVDAVVSEVYTSNPDAEIIITDLSVSVALAKTLDGNRVTLIDHHKSALALNQFSWCHVQTHKGDIMTCATELVYDWLLEQGKLVRTPELDRFVEAVRNLDTWRWKARGDNIAKQVNDLFYIYGREEFIAWLRPQIEVLPKLLAWLRRKIGLNFPALSKEDMAVLEARQRDIDRYVEEKQAQLRIATLCGRQCGVVFAENYFSTLGNKLAMDNPDIDFVVMIDMARSAVSYRSVRDDIDLGAIAKQFGGGGHPQAAGSKFVIGDEFWRAVFG